MLWNSSLVEESPPVFLHVTNTFILVHCIENRLKCIENLIVRIHDTSDRLDLIGDVIVVVDAVFSERVSGKNSLLTGNLTGKNRKFGLLRIVLEDFTPIYSAKRESYRPFPCYLNNRE